MKSRARQVTQAERSWAVALYAAAALIVAAPPCSAQLLGQREVEAKLAASPGRTPMTALPAKVVEPKRTAEGWPDFQGIWSAQGYFSAGAQHSLEQGRDPGALVIGGRDPKTNSTAGVLIDPMRGMIPYQPWAQAKRMEHQAGMYAPARRLDIDPNTLCFQVGVVGTMIPEAPWELRYAPGYVVIPVNNRWRTGRLIPIGATPHLDENIKLFNGDSRGRWEGNTLVIETRNNREGTWLDAHGTFHSDAMRVTERLTMVTQDTLYYEVTITDPAVFTQPWKFALNYDRVKREPGNTTVENTCHEAENTVSNSTDRIVRAGRRARQAGIKGYYIHMDLTTGKAIRPEEQKYLDESGQPPGYVFAPSVTDEDLATRKWDPKTRSWVAK